MARRVDNIYTELFEQLPVPERLEPNNIAAMLSAATAKEVPTEKYTRNITLTSNKKKTGAAFRSITSLAACAALAFGVAGYMGVFDTYVPTEPEVGGGSYASEYDDVHKTFEKYYIDDEDKKTLDSRIRDIDHSYNESENSSSGVTAQPKPDDTVEPDEPTAEPAPSTSAPEQDPVPDNTVPTAPAVPDEPDAEPEPVPAPDEEQSEIVNEALPLPKNKAEDVSGGIAFGDGFMVVRDANTLRIITTGSKLRYTGNIFPFYGTDENGMPETAEKALIGFYADGTKLTAVYSVTKTSDPATDALLDSLYGTRSGPVHSVEVTVYDIRDGVASLTSDVVQVGSLIDMNYSNGALYLVTAYSDYRVTPIIGVDDLESYVPSYTVNGMKYYVEAKDIMIPEYLATTDYTVISGISTSGTVSVQAVLGYEGRVILKNNAVYLFGYDSFAGTDVTSVKVFSLSGGNVLYAGYKDIDGIALGGDGISVFRNTIALTTVAETIDGYVTVVGVYDGTMNLVARLHFPGALTTAVREGTKIYLSGANAKYGIDLSNPSNPTYWEVEGTTQKADDPAEGLVEMDGGYVTLTKTSAGLTLAKLSKTANGTLKLDYKTVIRTGDVRSKALDNNGVLFVSGSTVGVPYGYFDGLDYCFKYALYHAGANGFELIGETEAHETNDAFENGNAALNGGYLYVFSEGRIYKISIQDDLAVQSTADIIESAYSGHTSR